MRGHWRRCAKPHVICWHCCLSTNYLTVCWFQVYHAFGTVSHIGGLPSKLTRHKGKQIFSFPQHFFWKILQLVRREGLEPPIITLFQYNKTQSLPYIPSKRTVWYIFLYQPMRGYVSHVVLPTWTITLHLLDECNKLSHSPVSLLHCFFYKRRASQTFDILTDALIKPVFQGKDIPKILHVPPSRFRTKF